MWFGYYLIIRYFCTAIPFLQIVASQFVVIAIMKKNMTKREKIYTGLTDRQVEESRALHGINVLTPPVKTTMWQQFVASCRHWISIMMMVLFAAAWVFAFCYEGNAGADVWIVPAVVFGSSLFVVLVGFFGGFSDPLFKILIAAFVLSMGISVVEFIDIEAGLSVFLEPIGIIIALLLATGVAFVLEKSNEKTFQSLNEADDDTLVKVVRNSNVCQVARRDIVVGDIVLLDIGEEVPADCQLLESFNLIVNESTLTGELQADKTTDKKLFDVEATYPSDMIMKGTTIIEGYCTARVVSVGDKTESGKVFEAAQVSQEGTTPLSEKLNKLAQLITRASYLIAGLVIVGRLVAYFFIDHNVDFGTAEGWLHLVNYLLQTVMIAVTLIVVAVPEGLPMSITLSLAFSMRKLMKENTLPRTIHACETMGAASVICTDKTGTLTQNQMQVADSNMGEVAEGLVDEMIALNSTANLDYSDNERPKPVGNPTEGALLLWLNNRGVDYASLRRLTEIIDRLPFTTENKYMATLVYSYILGKNVIYIKGAPEILLAMSDISPEDKQRYETLLSEYQNKAMRTLALAYADVPSDGRQPFAGGRLNVDRLHFVGVFAISDPIREEVPAAIRSCIDAGIQVKIVTGDTSATAKEIGRQIGLWNDGDTDKNIMTGAEFGSLSDNELAERVQQIKILSRAKPNDKERLVRLLREQDLVVAVTGDGTNDAPALNAADVGLSMGDGTAVAKEASDMTIQDCSFRTIANAVMWGRSLYKNIQRFILFQMTVNVVACLIVLVGSFIGTQSPLTVTQMLWVNLIMDTFAEIALASLPPSKGVMKEKPRRVSDSIISRAMAKNIIGVGTLFFIILFAVLLIMQHADIHSITDIFSVGIGKYDGLSRYELSLFFTIFVMMQFWNMFNAKSFMGSRSAFARLRECRGFMFIAFVIFVGQIVIVELFGKMFNVTHIHPFDWVIIVLSTSLILWTKELYLGRKRTIVK